MESKDWAQRLKSIFSPGAAKGAKSPKREEIESRVKNSSLFKDVPHEKIIAMIGKAEVIKKETQDIVLREGEEGDFYYILLEGKASVVRRPTRDADPAIVARLESGQAFGEEALISNAKRNATVIMNSEGFLLRVPKDIFGDYMRDSLVTWMNALQCQHEVTKGARWLDVRSTADYRKGHMPNAISAPLADLRVRAEDLDKSGTYICCCGNGRKSATAAFILRQRGFDAAVLQGGLRRLGGFSSDESDDPWGGTRT
jgi:rhodanese-related sulfurtransferase